MGTRTRTLGASFQKGTRHCRATGPEGPTPSRFRRNWSGIACPPWEIGSGLPRGNTTNQSEVHPGTGISGGGACTPSSSKQVSNSPTHPATHPPRTHATGTDGRRSFQLGLSGPLEGFRGLRESCFDPHRLCALCTWVLVEPFWTSAIPDGQYRPKRAERNSKIAGHQTAAGQTIPYPMHAGTSMRMEPLGLRWDRWRL